VEAENAPPLYIQDKSTKLYIDNAIAGIKKEIETLKTLETRVTGLPEQFKIDETSPHAEYFRLQYNPKHNWGQEAILMKPLRAGTEIEYGGEIDLYDDESNYNFVLSDNTYLNPLKQNKKPIGVVFNDDYLNLIRNKAQWEAIEREQNGKKTVIFSLQNNARVGDVCCVGYGKSYVLPSNYINK
jgi:hypothetical protein